MKQIFKFILVFVLVAFLAEEATAQTTKWREIHKVKRKETIFGIARDNGLTVDELIEANPEMTKPGYELKKGDFIYIPFPSKNIDTNAGTQTASAGNARQGADVDMRKREIRIGVMLPLHDDNGDGRRMVEYYRGVLMACDSLKKNGISVDIHAWNVPEDADIKRHSGIKTRLFAI